MTVGHATKGARCLALMLVAASMLGQSDNEPYFSLSSYRTYATNADGSRQNPRPTVALSAYNIDSLEFRVYRVNDATRFFQQLDDPHQFGGRVPRPTRERTLVERFHAWKRSLRADIRRELRAQFTESPSDHWETLFPPSKPAPPVATRAGTVATQYAETPILNSQQLVMSFARSVRASRWDREDVEIPVTEKGVYLVEAVRKDLSAYTLITVSDLTLISKSAAGKLLNIVVDRKTGQPVPGVDVNLLLKSGQPMSATTNADGMVEWSDLPAQQDDVIVMARRDRDVAVNTVSIQSGARAEQWEGYFFTDRPVYRPSHTVHFKGIVRLRAEDGLHVPAGRPIAVQIMDPDQKPVYQKTLTTSANGTIHDDLILAPAASLGSYYIQAKAGDGFMSGNFEVEEYKKPEYEVRVTPQVSRVLQGESVTATIEAKYFFGEPVAGAKVKYSVYRDFYWFPLWYDSEDEEMPEPGADGDAVDDSAGDQLSDQEGQLNADGVLTITVPTTVSRGGDFRYRIEARVADDANREISGTGGFLATYGSFVTHIVPDRYVQSQGSRVPFTVEARDYDRNPVQTNLHVELFRSNYRSAPQRITSTDVAVGATGSAKGEVTLPNQGGSYYLTATTNSSGRKIQSTAYLWVSGSGWEPGESQNVDIVSDKKTYSAGDTARLIAVTGKTGTPVLITLEGASLRSRQWIRSTDSTAAFEVPITVKDEPGLTITAAFLRDGVLHSGTKYLRVPPVEHTLNVDVTTDRPQYLPGQAADYRIAVTGKDGKPVSNAELTLGVVDEAIYSVRRDTTPSIVSFFFGRQYNRVYTATSLDYYFSGQAGKRRMRLAELRPRSRLAQLKPQAQVQPKVRKLFPDTAFWLADVVTDGSGTAHARVTFPDSLTTWRATTRGITADSRVGGATLKTIVRKNVILRLAVPRFFVQGDEVVISALVHNYLNDAKTARVSLDVKGLDILDGGAREVQIPSKGEVTVNWRVRAQAVSSVTVTGKALTNEESDALEMTLPVRTPGIKLSRAQGGSISAGATAAFDINFPANVHPGSRTISLKLSPSVAGALFGALDFLTNFPYGCVEQTMSSFLPNIVVKDAVTSLGLKATFDEPALRGKISEGLERLYSFQHEDSGWGWWQTDDSHPFMTAYVVAGLAQAKAAGVAINEDKMQMGATWVAKALANDNKLLPDLRAYMAYSLALAGSPNPGIVQLIYRDRANLSRYGEAILGLTFEQMKDARAEEVARDLERTAEQNANEAWWPSTRDPMLDFSEDVTPESTAYVAKLLATQRKDSPLLPKAAQWLMNHRNEGYWWSSTKQTAMVIYGLTGYLKSSNELMPKLDVTVFVNDKPVSTQRLTDATSLTQPEIVLDESKLEPGVNHIRITAKGEGRLYYAARGEYYSTEKKLEKTGTTSLNLLRDYYRLKPGRVNDRIVYDTVPLEGPVAAGDVLAVRLTVTGTDWKYLLIEDPIPAGTEFIERDSLYEMRERPSWWGYWFTRRELHDDHMAIFQREFPRGQQQYFYLLKVVNPGAFQVNPGRVEPMYQSGVLATTETRRLDVQENK